MLKRSCPYQLRSNIPQIATLDTYDFYRNNNNQLPVFSVYLDIGTTSTGTATVAFTFATTTSTARTWEIKVTQIECYSASRYFKTFLINS
jgi:hypothetical protein